MDWKIEHNRTQKTGDSGIAWQATNYIKATGVSEASELLRTRLEM